MSDTKPGAVPGLPRRAKAVAMVCLLALLVAVEGGWWLLGMPGGWTYAKLWGPLPAVAYWVLALRILRRRYGERRIQHERQRNLSARGRVRMFGVRYVIPALALFIVIMISINIGPAWRAAHGGGRAGTLRLHPPSCDRHGCDWSGDFRSDDGAVIRRNVAMHDPVPRTARPGDEIRARDTGDRLGVYALTGSHHWRLEAAVLVGCSAYLLGWALWLIVHLTRRRRARPGPLEIPALPERT